MTAPPAGVARGSLAGIEDAVRDLAAALGGDAAGIETTVTPAAVTLVASTAKNLLVANADRIRAIIINPLATALYVRKATLAASPATVSAGGYDFFIPPGGQWFSDPLEYAGGYNGICATAGDVGVSESI
jgi:hypothetical protein